MSNPFVDPVATVGGIEAHVKDEVQALVFSAWNLSSLFLDGWSASVLRAPGMYLDST